MTRTRRWLAIAALALGAAAAFAGTPAPRHPRPAVTHLYAPPSGC
jgi:hypothetical protein